MGAPAESVELAIEKSLVVDAVVVSIEDVALVELVICARAGLINKRLVMIISRPIPKYLLDATFIWLVF